MVLIKKNVTFYNHENDAISFGDLHYKCYSLKKNDTLKYNTSAKLDALNKGHSSVPTSTLTLSPFPLF